MNTKTNTNLSNEQMEKMHGGSKWSSSFQCNFCPVCGCSILVEWDYGTSYTYHCTECQTQIKIAKKLD